MGARLHHKTGDGDQRRVVWTGDGGGVERGRQTGARERAEADAFVCATCCMTMYLRSLPCLLGRRTLGQTGRECLLW